MALELQLIKHHSGILIPATPETSDILQSKTRLGDVLVAEFRRVRTGDRCWWITAFFVILFVSIIQQEQPNEPRKHREIPLRQVDAY